MAGTASVQAVGNRNPKPNQTLEQTQQSESSHRRKRDYLARFRTVTIHVTIGPTDVTFSGFE